MKFFYRSGMHRVRRKTLRASYAESSYRQAGVIRVSQSDVVYICFGTGDRYAIRSRL